MKDYYRILEVHPEASEEVIQKAYRTLARKHHPDQYHSTNKTFANERMKDLNEAYTTLNSSIRRQHYDKKRAQAIKNPSGYSSDILTEKIKNIGFWAALTFIVIGVISGFARVFFLTPVGRIILLVGIGLLIFRYARNKRTHTS